MAKFVKIVLKTNHGEETSWRLILENDEDLLKYANLDTELSTHAYLNSSNKEGHIAGTRANTIARFLEAKTGSLQEGELLIPIVSISEMLNKKYIGMHHMIQKGYSVCVNVSGGWNCLESFLKQWNGEILDMIEKPDFGFPVDVEDIIANTVVLENGSCKSSIDVTTLVNAGIKLGNIRMINNLKEIDLSYVAKAILQSENIILRSQLIDDNQLNMFMQMFSELIGKTVYLFLDLEAETKLRSHPLFKSACADNNIFIRR